MVAACAFLAGGYYESTYSLLAAIVWLGLAATAALRGAPRPSTATLVLLALLAWTLLSALWGPAGPALRAAPLVALYAGVLWMSERYDAAPMSAHRAPDVAFMNVNTPEELARARALVAEID